MLGQEIRSVSVGDMFFFLHGPGKRGKLATVLYGFWDGSNTHTGAGVWSLCGFLGEERAFGELDTAIKGVLSDPRWPRQPKRFHAFECVHGRGECEGWSFADRLSFWGAMISAIRSNRSLVAVSSVVVAEDFERLEQEERALLRSEALGEPLDLSVRYALERSITITRNTSEEESIGLLFDNENAHVMDRCYTLAKLYQTEFGFGKWLAGIGFGDSAKFTPLQAADLLAYGMYRLIADKRNQANREPDFPVEPGFLRLLEGTYKAGGGFDLDSMNKLAAEIKERHSKKNA